MKPKRRVDFQADGVLVVDKPVGLTSHDVVQRIRRRFAPDKLGHGGTLDPFADGVLVLIFNQATRLADLLGTGDKTYKAVLQLGFSTDTGDCLGQPREEGIIPELSEVRVQEILDAWLGERRQKPPAYSAVKHQGRPLYAYARQGVVVEKPARLIRIHQARCLSVGAGTVEFELHCSKGTYMRSLGEDLAMALGSQGHLKSLRRLASMPFTERDAWPLDKVLNFSPEEMEQAFLPAAEALRRCGLPQVSVSEDMAFDLRQGRRLPREALAPHLPPSFTAGAFQVMSPDGALVAVLSWLGQGEEQAPKAYETIRVFAEPKAAV